MDFSLSSSTDDDLPSLSYQTIVLVQGELSPIEKWHWLNFSIKTHDLNFMKELISAGVCVNYPEPKVPSGDEVAPLHHCVTYELLEGIRPLVEAGADVDVRTLMKYCQTPLHLAILEGSLPMIKELISLGADPHRLVRTGQVPASHLPSSCDCFELVERTRCTHSSSDLVDYFRQYQLFEEDKLKLSHLYWKQEPDVPGEMWWPTAVCVKDKIFVCERLGYTPHLCVFNVVTRRWSKLRFHESRVMSATILATTNNQVHCLGGHWIMNGKEECFSKVVFTLDCDSLQWSDSTLPPLNIGRAAANSTSFEGMIVVAGGRSEDDKTLSSVEVLSSSQQSSTWWQIRDLPAQYLSRQCTVSDTDLFVGCGYDTDHTIYSCNLSAAKEAMVPGDSTSPESFWHALPEAPLKKSGLAVVNNCLIAVGGHDNHGTPSSAVHLYDGNYKLKEEAWIKSKLSDLRRSRWSPAVVFCNSEDKQMLYVLGGAGIECSISVESCDVM